MGVRIARQPRPRLEPLRHVASDQDPRKHVVDAAQMDITTLEKPPITTGLDGTLPSRPSTFRHWIEDRHGARFRPEPHRYHLYVSLGCPWAHRTLIVRALKGLEGCIGVTAVHHRLDTRIGWVFANERPEPLYGLQRLSQLYRMAQPEYSGRITVPVLWDTREQTIVNNESADIVRMLGSVFDRFAQRPGVDLLPAALRPQIERWNERILQAVNAGAYAAGFADAQRPFDAAESRFFAMLEELDEHLGRQRFLVSDAPTEADWRLFPTLVRFAWVYHGLFRLNRRSLADHANLAAYARQLYQWPGIAATVDEHHIRDGYWHSMAFLNPSRVVPPGPAFDFTQPHGRA
jgi:putative glutathione S-transferase